MLRQWSAVLAVLSPFSLAFAQTPQPTCKNCPATYIQRQEVESYVQRAIANNLVDQQIRAVDIGKANVDIAVVYRGKLAAPAPDSVAEHDKVSEVYHIIDGSATLVTGPDLVDAKPRPADLETVRLLNGPGFNAASIRNGIAYELKPGDVVIIPAGTGHWFTRIDDHVTYLMVRIDPDKVTPNKTAADSQTYLASPAKK
jgi:mannose-6-phosphate isomerase-like protein (cupin superfamily)